MIMKLKNRSLLSLALPLFAFAWLAGCSSGECCGRGDGQGKCPSVKPFAPGERVTPDILEHIQFAKEKGCFMTGPQDMSIDNIQVVA